MAEQRFELKPAGFLDIVGQLAADAFFARTAAMIRGCVPFLLCAALSMAGIDWFYDQVARQIGLQAAVAIVLVLVVVLCMIPFWLMGVGGAVLVAGWRARLWRTTSLVKSGRSLVDVSALDELERVRFWLATGQRSHVLAMGDSALPALGRLLAGAPAEAARIEQAARAGNTEWQAALAAYRRGISPAVAEALVSLAAVRAVPELERARPSKPSLALGLGGQRVSNPLYEDFTIAIQKLEAMKRLPG